MVNNGFDFVPEPNTVAKALGRLQPVAEALNVESDSLSGLLTEANRRLAAFNVGLPVWLKSGLLREDRPQGKDLAGHATQEWAEVRLGYDKTEDGWGLATKRVRCVFGYVDGESELPFGEEHLEADPAPLQRASREVRLAALTHLPDLIELIADRAEKAVATIREAKASLQVTTDPTRSKTSVEIMGLRIDA